MVSETPSFFWRSREENAFNDWYVRVCDGMQNQGPWRVFWKGLNSENIPSAIKAAASASDDFMSDSVDDFTGIHS